MFERLDLTVSVPADDYAYLTRRVQYLEAMLLRVAREASVREWFAASELAAMLLPGLPASVEALSRRAGQEKWLRRKAKSGGKFVYAYHVSCLPARAFDALIARMLDLPDIDDTVPAIELLPPNPIPPAPEPFDDNTAPSWVLPLMRIMRTETNGDIGEAWERLPERLPPGVILPTVDEAAHVLVSLGLAGRG